LQGNLRFQSQCMTWLWDRSKVYQYFCKEGIIAVRACATVL